MTNTQNTNIFSVPEIPNSVSQHKEIDKTLFVSEIIPKLQEILVQQFPNNPQKQKIKVYPDRINFAAPCCGDSAKDNSKKRGNIILSGPFQMTYKCHNCGTRMSVYSFFKKYGQTLSLSAIEYFSAHKEDSSLSSTAISDSYSNYVYNNELINSYAIDKEYFKQLYSLEETSVPNIAHFYLINRKQLDFNHFLYQPKYQLLFLLNLTKENKIFGLQIAHLSKTYKGPKYKTYKLSRIYKELLKQDKEIPEEIDKLSMIFNILTVNVNYPVTVLEGPMDSFLIKNSIATCTAGKHIDFDFEYRYLFDDDLTGRKHSLEKLKEGYSVFTWDKLKQDLNLPPRKKWDVNDLVIWADQNKVKLPKLDNYFSNDSLDSLDI